VWSAAIKDNASLERRITGLPDVVLSARRHVPRAEAPAGVLVYGRTADGTDALAWVDEAGERVTQSQAEVFRAAACTPETPTVARQLEHHELVRKAIEIMRVDEQANSVLGLGPRTGARYKTYSRLKAYFLDLRARQPLFASAELEKAIDLLSKFPLREAAKDVLNRQIKAGMNDEDLGQLVVTLAAEDRLAVISEGDEMTNELRIICSLGLVQG
jgi:hypothetical protein